MMQSSQILSKYILFLSFFFFFLSLMILGEIHRENLYTQRNWNTSEYLIKSPLVRCNLLELRNNIFT